MALGMALANNPTLKGRAGDFALFMRANPIRGALIHSTLSTAITVSGVPFSLVDLGAAWVYPVPVALCMLLFAKTLGSVICFLIAKTVLPKGRKESVLKHPTVARVDRLLASGPIFYGTLFRLSSVPAFVKNYGLALLNISFPKYIACCLLGSVVGVPAQTYLGSKLGDFYLGFKDAEQLEADPWLLFGACVPILALIVIMPIIVKALLGKDEDDPDAKSTKTNGAKDNGTKDGAAKEGATKAD